MTTGHLLAIVFTAGWIPMYFARAEAIGEALPAYALSERLAVIATPIVLTIHMTVGCVLTSLLPEIPLPRALLAVAVYVSGVAFWFWGRILIGPLAVRRMPDEPPSRFRRDGAFGIVRHPLYCGCLTALAGPVVATLNPWMVVSYAVCATIIGGRAIQEESRLRAQLGAQYDEYCQEVKRLVPYVW